MDIISIRDYCIRKPGVTESFPFDNRTLVFKVMDKAFALLDVEWEEHTVNLKCDPEYALELRANYPECVKPGYHMNKKHWNTVNFSGGLPVSLLQSLIDHSYDLVVAGLTKQKQAALKDLK